MVEITMSSHLNDLWVDVGEDVTVVGEEDELQRTEFSLHELINIFF